VVLSLGGHSIISFTDSYKNTKKVAKLLLDLHHDQREYKNVENPLKYSIKGFGEWPFPMF
jgi:hypothetical protein